MSTTFRAGYHVSPIDKGILGQPSKIKEECDEFMDAIEQGAEIMALVELSDLVGAIEAFLLTNHPSIKFRDLRKMSAVTRRAFRNGRRL